MIAVSTSAHGALQNFAYKVPDTGTHTVELRVSDSTPFVLTPPSRSRIWTVQGLSGPTWILTVTKGGTGSGKVTSNPPGIDCGIDCTEPYASPTAVSLSANPESGSVFVGWLGACIGTGLCNLNDSVTTSVSATFAPSTVPLHIDIDGNNHYDALTDGLLIIRYLFGLTGTSLTAGALGSGATSTDPTQLINHLNDIRPIFDVDGNGQVDAWTDGLMLIRYLFGLRGSSLITGAVGTEATRTTAAQIEPYIQSLMP